jgi:NAD(P)-dependent dehydrogenase (short-subunit alcohol dehydrogenase family)
MPLNQRVAVITGATGATGRLAAQALAEKGAALALLSTNRQKLDGLAQSLNLPPERLLVIAADLTDRAAVFAAAEAIQEHFGRVDMLLHLVGGWTGGIALVDTPVQDLESMLRQHLWTTFHLIQAFLPALTKNGWGRAIVVSSPSAVKPPAKTGAYAIGKAAEETLMLTLAREVVEYGITANIIQVRSIDANGEGKGTPPREIVSAMLELCADDAATTNGERIAL